MKEKMTINVASGGTGRRKNDLWGGGRKKRIMPARLAENCSGIMVGFGNIENDTADLESNYTKH